MSQVFRITDPLDRIRYALYRMHTELTCPICLCLLDDPWSTPCNHLFCSTCLMEALRHQSACAICKTKVQRRSCSASPCTAQLVAHYRRLLAAFERENGDIKLEAWDTTRFMPVKSPVRARPISRSQTGPSLLRTSSLPCISEDEEDEALILQAKSFLPRRGSIDSDKENEDISQPEAQMTYATANYSASQLHSQAVKQTKDRKSGRLSDPTADKMISKRPLIPASDRPTTRTKRPVAPRKRSRRSITGLSDDGDDIFYDATSEPISDDDELIVPRATSLQSKTLPRVIVLSGVPTEKTPPPAGSTRRAGLSYQISAQLDDRTTHVVVSLDEKGCCRRTIKYLEGVVRGLWIVDIAWLRRSLAAGRWLAEAAFEARGDTRHACDSPKASRQARESGEPGLFSGLAVYFHGLFDTPDLGDLSRLVRLGGATVVLDLETAVAGSTGRSSKPDAPSGVVVIVDAATETAAPSALPPARLLNRTLGLVTGLWILDSVSEGALQPLEGYALC